MIAFPMASPNKSLKQVLQATLQCTKKDDDWCVLSNKLRKMNCIEPSIIHPCPPPPPQGVDIFLPGCQASLVKIPRLFR